jgi:hypothetical protein
MRAIDDHPVYWFGKRYGDLLLSHAEAGRDVGVVYESLPPLSEKTRFWRALALLC